MLDTDPARARTLIDAGLGDLPGTWAMGSTGPITGPPKFVAFNPPAFEALLGSDSDYMCADTIPYAGGRRLPGGGDRRLVRACARWISDDSAATGRGEHYLWLYASKPFVPASWRPGSRLSGGLYYDFLNVLTWFEPAGGGARLRLFAGRADPADASRFLIDYEVERTAGPDPRAERGVIEGSLGDDGRVRLELRPGPAADLWRQTGGSEHRDREAVR